MSNERGTWGYSLSVLRKRNVRSFHLLNGKRQTRDPGGRFYGGSTVYLQAFCGQWLAQDVFMDGDRDRWDSVCPGCLQHESGDQV